MIISNRHLALFLSVSAGIFGVENHVYCYHHLKEKVSFFLTWHKTRGNKGKESALKMGR